MEGHNGWQMHQPMPSTSSGLGGQQVQDGQQQQQQEKDKAEKKRRAYKACMNCRGRKAKCDLGDPDNPREPPCSRCRREGVACTFPPSRRRETTVGVAGASQGPRTNGTEGAVAEHGTNGGPGHGMIQPKLEHPPFNPLLQGVNPGHHHHQQRMPPPPPPPTSGATGAVTNPATNKTGSDTSPYDYASPLPSRPTKLRRLNEDPLRRSVAHHAHARDPESLAFANVANPIDALDLLKRAADDADSEMSVTRGPGGGHAGERRQSAPSGPAQRPRPVLADYPLIKRGHLSPMRLVEIVAVFFKSYHVFFPMVPSARIPRTERQLAEFAQEELHLTTVFVLIVTRGETNTAIHDHAWNYMQHLITDTLFGRASSIGAVEALLLLSEYLPRRAKPTPPPSSSSQASAPDLGGEENENVFSWMLVGMAIRLAYMLGLDQAAARPDADEVENDEEGDLELDRKRLAWIYCYQFDRHISIRTGRGFWSRGPGLCFENPGTTGLGSLRSLRAIEGQQDDFASFVHASLDLVQLVTNVHDVLYPSPRRTAALVTSGDYSKYLDGFTETLNVFKGTWQHKSWSTFPLTELIWINHAYVQLYINAFAFQAHVQRATSEAGFEVGSTSSGGASSKIFPRGPMGSPDARFIIEAVSAATELLKIVVDKLLPGGALPYLPLRVFLYASFAGVFLLKATYVDAVNRSHRVTTLSLVKRLVTGLGTLSTEHSHHGIKFGYLVGGLLAHLFDNLGENLSSPQNDGNTPAGRSSDGPTPRYGATPYSFGPISRPGSSAQQRFPTGLTPNDTQSWDLGNFGLGDMPPELGFSTGALTSLLEDSTFDLWQTFNMNQDWGHGAFPPSMT